MALREIHDRPAMPDGLTVEAARTTRALHQHQALLSEGFGMPMEIAERLIRPPILEEEHAVVFIGHVDGQPVSCSLLATSAKTAGVYNVATPERFRGRGYGEALTWSAIEEGARRGCSHAALQASDAGYPLYRRMGFVDLGRYVQLAGPPPADRSV
ncbi:MAG: GNAT family N-acetyltransferase [Ilumatobacteraceae bacterium]